MNTLFYQLFSGFSFPSSPSSLETYPGRPDLHMVLSVSVVDDEGRVVDIGDVVRLIMLAGNTPDSLDEETEVVVEAV